MLKWFRRKRKEGPPEEPPAEREKAQVSREEAPERSPEAEKGLWQKFRRGLAKTRDRLKDTLGDLFEVDRLVDQAFMEELEEILVTADIGIETVDRLLEPSRRKLLLGEPLKTGELKRSLREEMLNMLSLESPPFPPEENPAVIFFIGVNGVGKTTTLAKVAWHLKNRGFSVLAVAADTFRAAAIEQLESWGERVGFEVIKQAPGADPGAVVYQGLEAARARETDVVLVDTAGRLHTKYNLMEELKKMVRVAGKVIPGAPHENILVLDATTGQNALSQVEVFRKISDVTGLVMTKLDGTARGGVLVALADRFGLPIHAIGVGEQIDDLAPFDPEEFARALTGAGG